VLTSFQALNWHLSKSDQNYQCCGDSYAPCFPTTDLPHFQIDITNSSPSSPKLVSITYGTEQGLSLAVETCEIDGETVVFASFTGSITNVVDGLAYYEIQVNGNTYYSDVFKIKSPECFRYQLCWDTCGSNIACYEGVYNNVLYFDKLKQAAPTFEPTVKGKENGNGEFTATYRRLDQYENMFFVGVCHVNAALQGMTNHDNIVLKDLLSNTEQKLSSVTVSDPTNECYFGMTISYKGESIESDGCCDTEHNNFEDNCDPSTDPGEPCPEDYSATLLPDGNGGLIAQAVNPPGPITSYTMYINGQPQGPGQSINLTTYGVYEVRIVSEGCTAIAQYIYNDPCANFDVDLICNGLKIDGTITGIPDGDTATISICDSDGTEVGTSFPFVADEEGIYTIKVETESGCTFLANKQLGSTVCDWDFTVVKSDTGVLSADFILDCPNPSYQWYMVTNGSIETPAGNTPTLTPTETGNYILEITCDGCVKRRPFLCIINPEKQQIEICNWPDFNYQTIVEAINNLSNTINVDLTELCEKLECLCDDTVCKTEFVWACVMGCKLNVDCPGYTVTWVDANGTFVGATYEPTSEVSGTVTITKDGCPPLSLPYEFKPLESNISFEDV